MEQQLPLSWATFREDWPKVTNSIKRSTEHSTEKNCSTQLATSQRTRWVQSTWYFKPLLSIALSSSAVDLPWQHRNIEKHFGNARNQTWDGWVWGANATSVLCRPPFYRKYYSRIRILWSHLREANLGWMKNNNIMGIRFFLLTVSTIVVCLTSYLKSVSTNKIYATKNVGLSKKKSSNFAIIEKALKWKFQNFLPD